jgi:hypothetical protein
LIAMVRHGFLLLISIFQVAAISKVVPSKVPAVHGMFIEPRSNQIWLSDTFRKLAPVSQVYDSQGKAIPTLPAGKSLAGISIHPSQKIWAFCDVADSKIIFKSYKMDYGQVTVPTPWNARWAPSGDFLLAVSHNGSVYLVRPGQRSRSILDGLEAPFDIAFQNESKVWISEQGRTDSEGNHSPGHVCLYKFNIQAFKLEKRLCNKGAPLNNPEGLWPLPGGGVLVADAGNGTLVRLRADGETEVLERNLGIPILVQLVTKGNWAIFSNQFGGKPSVIFGTLDSR